MMENKTQIINAKLLIFIYTLLLLGTFLYLVVAKPFWNNPSGDFISNLIGAKLLAENSTNLYNLDTQRNVYDSFRTQQVFLPFRELPTTAVPYVTVSGFEKAIDALRGWYLINFGAIILSGLLIFRNVKKTLIYLFFSVLFYPIIDNFLLGQTGILLLLIVAFFHFFSDKQKYYLAGSALALLIIKPTFVILAIFLIATLKDKKAIKDVILGFCLTLAVILLLIAMVFQSSSVVSDNLVFLKTLRIEGFRENLQNQFSVGAILKEYFNMQGYKALFFNTIILSAGLIFVTRLKDEFKNNYIYQLLLIIIGVVSAISVFPHALAIIYPYLFKVCENALDEKNKKLLLYGILMYFAPFIAIGIFGRLIDTNPIINITILLIPTYLIADA